MRERDKVEEPGTGSFSGSSLSEELKAISSEAEPRRYVEEQLLASSINIGEKVELLLVKEGLKPASEIYVNSDEWWPGEPVNEVDKNQVAKVCELLEGLGLPYKILDQEVVDWFADAAHDFQYSRRARVPILAGRDSQSLAMLLEAHQSGDESAFGVAYGFPATAIAAYASGDVIDPAELPEEVRQSDSFIFGQHMLSRDHWQEELATGQAWAEAVKKYPAIYRQASDYYRGRNL